MKLFNEFFVDDVEFYVDGNAVLEAFVKRRVVLGIGKILERDAGRDHAERGEVGIVKGDETALFARVVRVHEGEQGEELRIGTGGFELDDRNFVAVGAKVKILRERAEVNEVGSLLVLEGLGAQGGVIVFQHGKLRAVRVLYRSVVVADRDAVLGEADVRFDAPKILVRGGGKGERSVGRIVCAISAMRDV